MLLVGISIRSEDLTLTEDVPNESSTYPPNR